uniref:Uncharacterized protein n=1 Tax=Globodera rostochiensis TaxID=31243 RepID=A0A914H8R6_GLORO
MNEWEWMVDPFLLKTEKEEDDIQLVEKEEKHRSQKEKEMRKSKHGSSPSIEYSVTIYRIAWIRLINRTVPVNHKFVSG